MCREDLVAVLSECRRRGRCRPRRIREFDWLRHRSIATDNRVVECRYQLIGEDLRVVEHVLDWPHRRARYAFAENLLPFERVAPGENGSHFRHQFSGVRGAAAHCRAARVAHELRAPDQLA